jgi:hypothetical protein
MQPRPQGASTPAAPCGYSSGEARAHLQPPCGGPLSGRRRLRRRRRPLPLLREPMAFLNTDDVDEFDQTRSQGPAEAPLQQESRGGGALGTLAPTELAEPPSSAADILSCSNFLLPCFCTEESHFVNLQRPATTA